MTGKFPGLVIVGSGLAALLLGAAWVWKRKSSKKSKKGREAALPVGTISAIYMYPIKSLTGMSLDEVQCSSTGPFLPHLGLADRHYVVTTKNYELVSLLTHPKMALTVPSIQANQLHIDAPDMETLIVPKPTEGPEHNIKVLVEYIQGIDCGDEAGNWFSTFLDTPGLRLCYSAPGMPKRVLRNRRDPTNERFLKNTKESDQIAYNNLSPFMLLCDASIKDFNSRIDKPVSAANFRPNFTISGTGPFDDDNWKELYIGDAEFSFIRCTLRCPRTQVDPKTGVKRADNEPLKTLKTYRIIYPDLGEKSSFGTDWVLDQPGTVRKGDTVYAVLK